MSATISLEQNVGSTAGAFLGTFATLSVIFFGAKIIYNLFFHPLHHIPGPKINALSRIPYVRHILAGTTTQNVVDLHGKYGEVVRLSPTQVSFIAGETAWPEIYGFRTGKMKGHLNMQKDPAWYAPPVNGAPSILIADDENHTRGRRILAHAFSEKALSEQEVLLHKYADQLVNQLKEAGGPSNEPVDLVKWYNWTTFDIIADLMFGEPFGCLQNRSTHKYVTLLFKGVKAFRLFYIIKYYPLVKYLGSLFIDKNLLAERIDFAKWVDSQVKKRMSRETQRPDFMTQILKHNGVNDEKGPKLSDAEMTSNATLMLTAGSETTATLLSAVTFFLMKNPKIMERLKNEIRSRFENYFDITLEQVNTNTPYLLAVLWEGLRFFPPVPNGFERRVSKGGEIVCGYFIPEGTAVSVSQYPCYRSESNFKNPNKFAPERWMGDPEYAHDKRNAVQPFSFGPRNCLGKNLALAEMRLILAKMIWSFDLDLQSPSANWDKECRTELLWVKPPLLTTVKEVARQ